MSGREAPVLSQGCLLRAGLLPLLLAQGLHLCWLSVTRLLHSTGGGGVASAHLHSSTCHTWRSANLAGWFPWWKVSNSASKSNQSSLLTTTSGFCRSTQLTRSHSCSPGPSWVGPWQGQILQSSEPCRSAPHQQGAQASPGPCGHQAWMLIAVLDFSVVCPAGLSVTRSSVHTGPLSSWTLGSGQWNHSCPSSSRISWNTGNPCGHGSLCFKLLGMSTLLWVLTLGLGAGWPGTWRVLSLCPLLQGPGGFPHRAWLGSTPSHM